MRNRLLLALPTLLAFAACSNDGTCNTPGGPVPCSQVHEATGTASAAGSAGNGGASGAGAGGQNSAAGAGEDGVAGDPDGNKGQDGAAGATDGSLGSDGAAGNTDAQAQADCGAIELLPPILEVVDAVTGTPICDPTFMVDIPDGGASAGNGMPIACSQSVMDGCPGRPDGGGTAPCAFSIGIFNANNVSVAVSHAGYETAIVQVSSGEGGCVPYVPASHLTVELHSVADASADGG